MRVCDICGGTFSIIDWENHKTAHLSPAEKDELMRQMQEERRRNPTPVMPENEVFRGFDDDVLEDVNRNRRGETDARTPRLRSQRT